MRYLLVAALGLLIGAAAAGAAIYYNPFIMTKPVAARPRGSRAALLAAGRGARLRARRARSCRRAPPKRDDCALGRDDRPHRDAGPRARRRVTASRRRSRAGCSRFPRAPISCCRACALNDYWLLTIPGEGTLFLRADTNVWPFLQETLAGLVSRSAMEGPGRVQPDGGARRARRGRRDRRDGPLRGARGHGDREVSAHRSRSRGAQRRRHRRARPEARRVQSREERVASRRFAHAVARAARSDTLANQPSVNGSVRGSRSTSASIVNAAPISFFACANSRGLLIASTAISSPVREVVHREALPRGVAAQHGRVVAV